jgi:hypothetical protein
MKEKLANQAALHENQSKLNVINEEIIYNIVPSFRDNSYSTMSKRNQRYSNTDAKNASLVDPDFKLIEDEDDDICSPVDQFVNSIANVQEDNDNKVFIEGANGRKLSFLNLKSPERNEERAAKKHLYNNQAINQQSTLCSNTMNKSSKKSGFEFSYDPFNLGDDDTLTNSRQNHKKDILNM